MSDRKKPFNKFTLAEAYNFLNLTNPIAWEISFLPIEPTPFFNEELKRLEAFDLESGERGKEVLIDSVLQEALTRRTKLKVWKEVHLKTNDLRGRTEYLLAQRFRILKNPFVCIAEAKKDDFQQGAAQCLLAMKASQIINLQSDFAIDIYGMVTNAFTWRFYRLTLQDRVFESKFYSFQTQTAVLFGILDSIFKACEENLDGFRSAKMK